MKKKPNNSQMPAGGISRQSFLRAALGGAGICYAGIVGYPVYRYLESPVEKAEGMAAVKEVTLDPSKVPVGTAAMFKFGSRPAMLIHHTDGTWVALIAVCSHLGCTVQYEGDKDRIFCACHGGVYNAHTGGNVSGPPPHPLERLDVKVADAGIVVSRMQKSA